MNEAGPTGRGTWYTIIGLWLLFDVSVVGLSVAEKTLSLMIPFAVVNGLYAVLALLKYRLDRGGL